MSVWGTMKGGLSMAQLVDSEEVNCRLETPVFKDIPTNPTHKDSKAHQSEWRLCYLKPWQNPFRLSSLHNDVVPGIHASKFIRISYSESTGMSRSTQTEGATTFRPAWPFFFLKLRSRRTGYVGYISPHIRLLGYAIKFSRIRGLSSQNMQLPATS